MKRPSPLWLLTLGYSLCHTLSLAPIAQAQFSRDRILSISGGTVLLDRPGTTGYRFAHPGQSLQPADLIRPLRQAIVTVLCSNGSSRSWSGSPTGVRSLCPSTTTRPRSTGPRGQATFLDFLYGQAAFQTNVLEAQPQFHWQPLPGTDRYHVALSQAETILWETETNTTAIVANAITLLPDISYTLNVTALDGPAMGQVQQLTIQRLTIDQATEANAQIQQLTQTRQEHALNENIYYLLLNEIYDTYQLNWQTIARLQESELAHDTLPELARQLGDAALQLGWLDTAQQAYTQALTQAEASRNYSEQASAKFGLATIAITKGNRQQAYRWLYDAQNLYALARESDQADKMAEFIHKLALYKN